MDEDEACMIEEEEEQEKAEIDNIQHKYIRKVYDNFDLDNNGVLSYKELRKGLQKLGLKAPVDEVKAICKHYKMEKRKIGYEEFEEIIREKLINKINPSEGRQFDLFTAFCVFDKDGDGFIDKKELSVCLQRLGDKMTPLEVDDLFSKLDEDNNGRLSVMEMSKILAE